MTKNSKFLERLIRSIITLLGAGVGAGIAALLIPLLGRQYPTFMNQVYGPVIAYCGLILLGGLVFFALSYALYARCMQMMSSMERWWDGIPTRQGLLMMAGLIAGLVVAALLTQLILSVGASLLTVSFSALMYVILGYVGMRIGMHRYREGKGGHRVRRHSRRDPEETGLLDAADLEEDEEAVQPVTLGIPPKLLDTSVIIDGRILDIVKTGFLEGDIVIAQFVLAELRHIADSGDSLRRARGRRGLDVLAKLRELSIPLVIEETDYADIDEVDVKLLRLCRDKGGIVVTNDYNLNKVAGVTGIRVLNINDLANAVKPMLMAGEEMNVQIVREGKEPGQGVAYLDDGTMIVVENGRRHVGETVAVVVTTVLQTSAGRMIFTRLKSPDEKAC